jgi:hypothetical protein
MSRRAVTVAPPRLRASRRRAMLLVAALAATVLSAAVRSGAAVATGPAAATGGVLAAASGRAAQGAPAKASGAADPVAAIGAPADLSVQADAGAGPGAGGIPAHFVGFSIEWSLVERYMGPAARPAFANLLRNLGTGELRIGGSSQDLMPFDATAPNTNRIITPEDLGDIRATLDAANAGDARVAVPSWGTILGTAMAPPDADRPWVGPEHAEAFARQGVAPAFAGGAERDVAGIGLGNEPDISYGYDLAHYLADLTAYRDAGVTRPFPIAAPSTSEPVAPWQSIDARAIETRFFWDWPTILDTIAPAMNAVRGQFGALATDHFYPLARGCATDEYRCATIERLLADDRLANLDYQVFTHATQAAQRGLSYRLQETSTAAGRGVDGVSNVDAAAIWALAAMFEAACPQPPNAPGANADCRTGAVGINLHNAEVNDFFAPEEGNAYYNAVDYDPSPAAGAPSAAPPYYGLLLFSRFAQGTVGLRPLALTPGAAPDARVRAWQVGAGADRRLFLINMSARPLAVAVAAPAARYELDRMTPFDPTGAGRTLDAPQVRIDGRAVSADGSWPGFAPQVGRVAGGRLRVALGTGEAAVVTLHAR